LLQAICAFSPIKGRKKKTTVSPFCNIVAKIAFGLISANTGCFFWNEIFAEGLEGDAVPAQPSAEGSRHEILPGNSD
jgi:hypothetical protein